MNGYTRGELTVHHEPAELTKVTKALRDLLPAAEARSLLAPK